MSAIARVLTITLLLSAHASTQRSLEAVLRGSQASAVVLDWNSGRVLAKAGPERRMAPGSVLKPILLDWALAHGVVRPEMSVYCRRSLRVAGRNLACTHPPNEPRFTAETALAESCNTWFAEMARRMTGMQIDAALREAGIPHGLPAGADADARVLAVLGLGAESVTPEELARAYRELLLHAPQDGVVARGLRASVEVGMANPAQVRGVVIEGKTGTASDPGQAWTHGWFAGGVPGKFVVVVQIARGDGGGAAALAAQIVREEMR